MADSGRPSAGIISEAIAARSHDQRVALVSDRGEEVTTGADGYRHQERIRPEAEIFRKRRRNGRHDKHRRRIVEEWRHSHGGHQNERQGAGRRQHGREFGQKAGDDICRPGGS